MEGLLDALREDEKSVLSALGRGNVAALVQLLTATAPKIREKAATVLCLLAESGSCEGLLVSEGALPPLIRLAESGSLVGREKAVITLQRLSMSPEIARAIVGHNGGRGVILDHGPPAHMLGAVRVILFPWGYEPAYHSNFKD